MSTARRLTALIQMILFIGLAVPTALLTASPGLAEMPLADEEMQIAALLGEFEGMSEESLQALPARQIERHVLPPDGADVMRVRLTETYDIHGLGQDTVELTGWIAVKHTNARAADGSDAVPTWENAVVDTQFVGMELRGESEVFGRVQVTLDDSRGLPLGQVGKIELPPEAQKVLLAELNAAPQRREDSRAGTAASSTMRRGLAASMTLERVLGDQTEPRALSLNPETVRELSPEALRTLAAGACAANVRVNIALLDLDLEMRTASAVGWYSIVETIPPVGETASIAIEPVSLVSEGREIGTLLSGKVAFREVVRFVAFNAPSRTPVEEEMQLTRTQRMPSENPIVGMAP